MKIYNVFELQMPEDFICTFKLLMFYINDLPNNDYLGWYLNYHEQQMVE